MTAGLERTNQVERQSEAWQPPAYKPPTTPLARLEAVIRRFLDLQAGSVWNDLAILLPQSQGVVLDVGCGAQPYRYLLSPLATYKAIDYAGAETNFGYSMPDTTYYAGDTWPIADGSIDVILCTETMEHVPEPATFLDEAARCLRPEGRLILTVPFAARWHYIPHDYWRYTPSTLERLLSRADFTNIAVHARGNPLTVACYKVMALMLPLLLPQRGSLAVRFGLRALGVLTAPLVITLAAIGHLSLRGQGGDDCLGYTVIANKA